MKKIILLLITVLTLMSCSENLYNGSGDLTSEMRNVSSFTKVKSEGIFNVNIVQGETQSVEVIADDNIIHKVNTKVVNNELRLSLKNGNYQDITLNINITVKQINGIKNTGSANMYIDNVAEQNDFRIDNMGSGDIIINGIASKLFVENEGSGSVLGFGFFVEECNVEIIGSGNLEINCSNKLNIEIEGSGNVYYKGNPQLTTDITGSGQVISRN